MTPKDKISRLCKMNGINVSKLEKELGFGAGTISRWDGVRKPAYSRVYAVAQRLGVSVQDLTEDSDSPIPQPSEEVPVRSEPQILYDAFQSAPSNVQEAIRKLLGLP